MVFAFGFDNSLNICKTYLCLLFLASLLHPSDSERSRAFYSHVVAVFYVGIFAPRTNIRFLSRVQYGFEFQ
ncbi:hypothetical protein KR51_00015970 [Rubidibacter lacunae KORDI 51-2]|uniref:Uncharacterized protein n=1 Tax=Rubidibacter lacunae KORDI 51-2 TaxID=582515 RepID=U5DMD0_9CHRO|nr:hypothetical protein KR51_00015970 [Rubidibacter lacunae KORDI 51-2]